MKNQFTAVEVSNIVKLAITETIKSFEILPSNLVEKLAIEQQEEFLKENTSLFENKEVKPIEELLNDHYLLQIRDMLPYGDTYKSHINWKYMDITKNTKFIVFGSTVEKKELVINTVKLENNPYPIVLKLIEWGFYNPA